MHGIIVLWREGGESQTHDSHLEYLFQNRSDTARRPLQDRNIIRRQTQDCPNISQDKTRAAADTPRPTQDTTM